MRHLGSDYISRPYRHSEDFEAVMGFLRETYVETGSLQNWLPPRFENSANGNEADTRIWKTRSGRIVGALTPEEKLRFFIQVHPNHTHLYTEIISWIDGHYAEDGRLAIITLEGDPERENTLRRHGFEKGKVYGVLRLRDVNASIPIYRLPDGFTIRSVDSGDFDELARAVRIVFGHGEWFNGDVVKEISCASFYHDSLDLVAVDSRDEIAAFCTFRLDEPSGIVELEPMGTLPRYHGLGLAKALLCEGFKRLNVYGPTLLYIGGAADTPAANRLYEATGFTTRRNYYFWSKKRARI